MPLANVQHLHTPIQAQVGEQVHLLDIAAVLHPTPAVGGTPREPALPDIAVLEAMDRGLYAGLVGLLPWFLVVAFIGTWAVAFAAFRESSA